MEPKSNFNNKLKLELEHFLNYKYQLGVYSFKYEKQFCFLHC